MFKNPHFETRGVAAEILGHSSSQITERTYLHPDLGVRAEAINHLSAAADTLLS